MSLVQVTYPDIISVQDEFVKPADENEQPSNRTWRLTREDGLRLYVDLADLIRQLPPDRNMFIQQLERLQMKQSQTGLEKRQRRRIRSACTEMLCVSSPLMMHCGTRKRKSGCFASGTEDETLHSAGQNEMYPNLRTFVFPTVSYETTFMDVPVEISPQDVQNCTECKCPLEGRPVTTEWLIRLLKTRLRNV